MNFAIVRKKEWARYLTLEGVLPYLISFFCQNATVKGTRQVDSIKGKPFDEITEGIRK